MTSERSETTSTTDSRSEPARTDGRPAASRGEGTAGSTGLHPVTLFGSHLAVGVLSAAAGVVIGGLIAFETGYWFRFREWIHGLGRTAVALAAGLLLLAVVVSLVAAVRSSRR